MNFKSFVGCIYVKNEKCVKSFSDETMISDDPVALAEKYFECDMDAIIVFDLSDTNEMHHAFVHTLETICKRVAIPVYAGGNMKQAEDAKRFLSAGCQKVVLNFAKQNGQDMLKELSQQFGQNRIAATIASEDTLYVQKEALEEYAGELILIDEYALKNILGTSILPCIVFLPEISLDKMMMMMEKPNVAGISGNIVNENSKEITALKSICQDRSIPVRRFEPAIPFSELKLLSDGLIPVVVQDYLTNQVLMVAYMNEEAYLATLRTRKMTYYSRSRKELWVKGMTSGHFQYVKSMSIDCDNDTLLARVKQIGAACHTGNYSCFYRDLIEMDDADCEDILTNRALLEKNNEIAKESLDFAKKLLKTYQS